MKSQRKHSILYMQLNNLLLHYKSFYTQVNKYWIISEIVNTGYTIKYGNSHKYYITKKNRYKKILLDCDHIIWSCEV